MDSATYWDDRLSDRRELAMAPGDWVRDREVALRSNAATDGEVHRQLVAEVAEENQRVIGAVMELLKARFGLASERQANFHILDVALGTGDLTSALLPYATEKHWHYQGIDQSVIALAQTARRLEKIGLGPVLGHHIRLGSIGELTSSRGGWIRPGSIDLVIWGRLGIHLSAEGLWRLGLAEVDEVLTHGGHFLLFETIQELNQRFQVNPEKHSQTRVRSQREYEVALNSFQLEHSSQVVFCGETIGILLWKKLYGLSSIARRESTNHGH